MNLRQRILSEGNFHCACGCGLVLKNAEEVVSVSMYVKKGHEENNPDIIGVKKANQTQLAAGLGGFPKAFSEQGPTPTAPVTDVGEVPRKKEKREKRKLNKALMEAFAKSTGQTS